MRRIFLSSVQREFAEERRFLKRYIEGNPVLRRFFSVFAFEFDVPAKDKTAKEVFLSELENSDIYVCLIGGSYGSEDRDGRSPTEVEFDAATKLGLPRLVFVKDDPDGCRAEKEIRFLEKVSSELSWVGFSANEGLLAAVYASLDELIVSGGHLKELPFDVSPCEGATMEDIDDRKVAWLVEAARTYRNADLQVGMDAQTVLKHLQLFVGKSTKLTNAAILLLGKEPQRFHISSEIKCAQWYGTERHKPMLSYQVYKGNLFEMADSATSFVLSKLNLSVGTRESGNAAPREYEIPRTVIAEAVINAIAHRDYVSTGSIQVEVFVDRVVIRNPGKINPAITKDELFKEHASYPNNPKIADQLYLAKYIEKFGTGFTDLVRECREAGLKDPEVEDDKEFTVTIWRTANKLQTTKIKARELLDYVLKHPTMSVADLANELQIKPTTLRVRIDALKKLGLRHIGSRKSGKWILDAKI